MNEVNTGGSVIVEKGKRMPFIEIARLIATLIVIMQHVPCGPWSVNECLIGPALALFFVLSGFFNAAKLSRMDGVWLIGRLKGLLIPYLFWCFVYWCGTGCVWEDGGLLRVFGVGYAPMLTPMWFLRDLMIFTLLSFLLQKWKLGLYVLGLTCLFLNRWDDTLAWPSPYMFGDYVLGILLGTYAPQFPEKFSRLCSKIHIAIVMTAVGLVLCHCFLPELSVRSCLWVIVLAMLCLSVLFERIGGSFYQTLCSYSEASFFVYCTHIILIIFMMPVVGGVLHFLPHSNEIWWLLVPIIYVVGYWGYCLAKSRVPQWLCQIMGVK